MFAKPVRYRSRPRQGLRGLLQKRRIKYRLMLLFIVVVVSLLAFCANAFLSKKSVPTQLVVNTSVLKKEIQPGKPLRLKIPKIKVDAAIETVGINPQGDLEVPKGAATAGLYIYGPRPGQLGSSVIDGHFGYKDNIPAIFDDLHKLKVGDKLYVDTENAGVITFSVREIKTYKPEDDSRQIFSSDVKSAHLNLITCHGDWSNADKSFSNRLVVFTDREV